MSNHIRQFVSFFSTGNRQHFWNTDKYLWWSFFAKKLTAKSCSLFLQKISTIDFWLGSKYSSWHFCLKYGHLKDI